MLIWFYNLLRACRKKQVVLVVRVRVLVAWVQRKMGEFAAPPQEVLGEFS